MAFVVRIAEIQLQLCTVGTRFGFSFLKRNDGLAQFADLTNRRQVSEGSGLDDGTSVPFVSSFKFTHHIGIRGNIHPGSCDPQSFSDTMQGNSSAAKRLQVIS